jgi:probable rRNA maturation factor
MSCGINFFNENISYVIRKKRALREWFAGAMEMEGKVAGDINFIICDDDYLSEMNYKYLRHKSLTDILTFSSDNMDGRLSGDIFISLTRVRENAVKFDQKVEDELRRVMIHGILHLIGYNDSTKTEKEEMRGKENFYLSLFEKNQ